MSKKKQESLEMTEQEFLESYDSSQYERPSVTNDIIILTTENKEEENIRKLPRKGMQVLLLKRKEHPEKGCYSIPGGFVDVKEGLMEGAYRKLQEETGIKNVYIEQLYTFGTVERDPRTRVITVANMALVPKENIVVQENNKYETNWFWMEKKQKEQAETSHHFVRKYQLSLISEDNKVVMEYEVMERIKKSILREKEVSYQLLEESTHRLAFDHYSILDHAISRLRNKVEYTPIAVYLLPPLFTVKELQYVYEAILGREITNFRRKIGDMIVETDEIIEGRPFRPAQVYKFNENWEHEF
ncbi:NUDIX hydrolase [Anaeromicropila populeti]|nr:NUDIX domain-containing protein [Anaeromicropila populeti]